MSSIIRKYFIIYDGNDGQSYHEYIYCKYENSCDIQIWCNEDGSSLCFDCLTDNHAFILACCIAGIEVKDDYHHWKEVEIDIIPEAVIKKLNS